MSEFLTYDRALELLREVIFEKGEDFVYEAVGPDEECLYVHDGRPACIVGHVLVRAGVSLAELVEVETCTPMDTHRGPAFLTWADEHARRLLTRVQDGQDNGKPWGVALDVALDILAGCPDE
jgi:hypothetical protein